MTRAFHDAKLLRDVFIIGLKRFSFLGLMKYNIMNILNFIWLIFSKYDIFG